MKAERTPDLNERREEYKFALQHLEGCKTVLDVGPGRACWPSLLHTCGMDVTAIDSVDGYWGWRGGLFNHHFLVQKADILEPPDLGHFDAATCISTLEHIENWQRALENMRKLADKVIVTVPFGEMYVPNIATHPILTQVFSESELGTPAHSFLAPRFGVGCFVFTGTNQPSFLR
jgi:ubiquinone/menaquinone biosynthesis C-methylase UbiE